MRKGFVVAVLVSGVVALPTMAWVSSGLCAVASSGIEPIHLESIGAEKSLLRDGDLVHIGTATVLLRHSAGVGLAGRTGFNHTDLSVSAPYGSSSEPTTIIFPDAASCRMVELEVSGPRPDEIERVVADVVAVVDPRG